MTDRSVQAEAAAWLARLRFEERTAADEAAFRVWLGDDPAHAAAFEALSAAWDAAGAYRRGGGGGGAAAAWAAASSARAPALLTRRAAIGAVTAGLVAVTAAGYFAYVRDDGTAHYVTLPGERRQVTLKDQSRVVLDSDSSLKIAFSGDMRRLMLERGRAYFDVAHDPARPFMVEAGARRVVALGTAFEIDHAPGGLSVLLVEGRVAVRSSGGATGRDVAFLRAGERLVFDRHGAARRDRPDMARLLVWREGQLIFDNDRLTDAVAQMKRYSSRPMIIAGTALGDRRVSGAFSTADPAAFARSLGVLLDVPVSLSAEGIVIGEGVPAQPEQAVGMR